MITKNILLNTGVFVDNMQLDLYLALTAHDNNADYLERHHIIPQKYFKLLGIKINNNLDNIVKLTAFNHIYAHYLLCFCTQDKLQKSCIKAFLLMTQYNKRLLTLNDQQVVKQLESYSQLRQQAQREIGIENSLRNKGRPITEEAKLKISIANKGKKKPHRTLAHKLALKKVRGLYSTTLGKRSIYNKLLDQVKFVTTSELTFYLNNGWRLGSRPLSADAKKKIGASNSIALKGKKHQNIQKGHKYSGLIGDKILCVEENMIFDSIAEAKSWLKNKVGIGGDHIKNCCAGVRETTGGYHWKHVKREEVNICKNN